VDDDADVVTKDTSASRLAALSGLERGRSDRQAELDERHGPHSAQPVPQIAVILPGGRHQVSDGPTDIGIAIEEPVKLPCTKTVVITVKPVANDVGGHGKQSLRLASAKQVRCSLCVGCVRTASSKRFED
jgi:hypothetical protein